MLERWKDLLLDGVTDVLDDNHEASKEPEIDVNLLHAKIGQLMLESDFLGLKRGHRASPLKALDKVGLLPSVKK